ncbi:MAG: hypothetical protein K9M44_03795, partial [Candidatus Pacebacteria bacterium]|nr:hypothetical protein [Candidatus Paceibacterota bacterium]
MYGGNLTSHSLLTLNNTDDVVSSTTLQIYQNFSSKSSTGQTASPANSGYFPDTYLSKMIRMYSSSDNVVPGAVRLGGLDVDKKYQVILIGSHTLVDANTDKTTTIYTVSGNSQELQTSANTSNVITFNDISPDENGNIDVYVAKKYAHWGYGVLNALKLVEQRQFSINYQAGTHGSVLGDTSQLINSGSNGSQVTAVAN